MVNSQFSTTNHFLIQESSWITFPLGLQDTTSSWFSYFSVASPSQSPLLVLPYLLDPLCFVPGLYPWTSFLSTLSSLASRLIQSHSFKSHYCADVSQTCVSLAQTSPLTLAISNCLLDLVSTWCLTDNSNLISKHELSIFKLQKLIFSWSSLSQQMVTPFF